MAVRPSEDIDLFSADRGRPAEVVADVVAAIRRHQLTVPPTRRTSDLVQMMVSGPGGETCKVDLGLAGAAEAAQRSQWPLPGSMCPSWGAGR
jgi:hypothetical protein